MTKKERAEFIIRKLEELYPHPDVPLDHSNPFTLLVAVLLSAQCTDERVNKTTPALFALADNAADMQYVPVETIREIIRPCGLSPAKSRAISELSAILVQKYGGEVPAGFTELEELPGVGHKTASVVMAQAFDTPAFPVDTHIHRLAHRWGISDGKNVKKTEEDCKKAFPRNRWNKIHLQIIFFGREYCPARGHQTASCPICAVVGNRRD